MTARGAGADGEPRRGRPRRWWALVAAALVPGALGGAHVGALLYFLNPDIDFSLSQWLLSMVLFVPPLVLLAAALQWPWLQRRNVRDVLRLIPWTLTLTLALAGFTMVSQASHYGFYLPGGINQRLIKAGLSLLFGAVAAAYTALLHALHHRPYGLRSRILLTVIALGSLWVSFERRGAFEPAAPIRPVPVAVERGQRVDLLLVGLPGATLDAIFPLAEQGSLPFLADLVHRGAAARVGTLTPVRQGPLWSTVATGTYPFRHGVVWNRAYRLELLSPGDVKLLPSGLGLRRWLSGIGESRPIDATYRTTLALWDIFTQVGISTGVVAWPVSDPLPRTLTFGFSDRFFLDPASAGGGMPEELLEVARRARVDPEALDEALLARLPPQPAEEVRSAVARDLWRLRLTDLALDRWPQVEAVLITLPGLEAVSRRCYGAWAARALEGRAEPVFEECAATVVSYYQLLDRQLSELWQRWSGPAVLAVVSASGHQGRSGWERLWLDREEEARGSSERGPDGVLLLAGQGIRGGAPVSLVRVVDVAPTLLYAIGLPVARDMDGRVLTELFTPEKLAREPLAFVPSYRYLVAAGDVAAQ